MKVCTVMKVVLKVHEGMKANGLKLPSPKGFPQAEDSLLAGSKAPRRANFNRIGGIGAFGHGRDILAISTAEIPSKVKIDA